MNIEIELSRPDLYRKIKVKSHDYDLVELTIRQQSYADTGKELTSSYMTTFYSQREFKEFMQPLVNQLKKEFDNDTTDNVQE
jgi:hypothetical protein